MDSIKKITAPNGGIFTGKGTNTHLVGQDDITLIDPGPNIQEHVENILLEGDGKINRILVTHTHTDHSPAALPISKELNIPMYGRLVDGKSDWEDKSFVPDNVLSHGDTIETSEYSLEVIHTPGHASNHLCFYLTQTKCLFTGDHIMDGSTVVIAPPDGNMAAYLSSLELLKNYDIENFAPGHGNYMDPLADKILMIGTLSSLLFLEIIELWPFLIIVGRDVVITFYRNYLIAKNKPLETSKFGKLKTVFQHGMVLIILLINPSQTSR